MRKWMILALFLAAGCASQPTQQQSGSYDNRTTNDTPTRHRARIHTELGSGYYSKGMLAVALDELLQASQIDPSYSPAFDGLGLVYSALNQDSQAEANFKRSLQLDASSSESHNNYGTFLCSRNRIDESIAEFMQAVKNPLYSTPEMAYLNAGICALRKQDGTNAERYLIQALQLQPALGKASYYLAGIYFDRGDAKKANEYLTRALDNLEASPEMLWLGVQITRQTGDKNAEASYAMLLKNKFPSSDQAKTLVSE